mmetsp:Transcript_4108/g.10366  ORF Transcript_4108/g.10366 Transcript_4108/m.10366 type:complete len:110 (-) Transcript_4108:2292-2621(-)
MDHVLDNLSNATSKALKPGASLGDVTGMSQAIVQASCHFKSGARSVGWGIFAGLLAFGVVVAGGMVCSMAVISRTTFHDLEERVHILEMESRHGKHIEGETEETVVTRL